MRIAYVVGTFPCRSETFIAREIETLEARGVAVEVFPLWRSREEPGDVTADRPVHWSSRLALRAQCQFLKANVRWQCYFAARLGRETRAVWQALWNLAPALDMARQMRALGVGRVHAHFANAPSTAGWVAASVAGVPFSLAVHARDLFVEAQFLADKARAADRIVACNSAAAARVAELIEPADREKVELIHHGLPLESYRLREGQPSRRPLILGVGRLVEKKGFVDLVRAVGRLRARGHTGVCWLIGEGPERAALEREIAVLGLGDAVALKGWMLPDELKAAYERASVLVVPSIVAADGDMDGLPNVVLEAAAIGVPIVATNVGGIGDLVRDGETGLVATAGDPDDLAEKIQAALADPAAATLRAHNARREVESRFDANACTDRLLEALGIGPAQEPGG